MVQSCERRSHASRPVQRPAIAELSTCDKHNGSRARVLTSNHQSRPSIVVGIVDPRPRFKVCADAEIVTV